MTDAMPAGPILPSTRHVWVHNHGRHGPGAPGVVVCWQPQPGGDGWHALVAVQQVLGELVVRWCPAELLDPITDPAPANWTKARRGVRHVWRAPLYDRGAPSPALLIDKRRTDREGWQAQVAMINGSGILVSWQAPGDIRPVTSDKAERDNSRLAG